MSSIQSDVTDRIDVMAVQGEASMLIRMDFVISGRSRSDQELPRADRKTTANATSRLDR